MKIVPLEKIYTRAGFPARPMKEEGEGCRSSTPDPDQIPPATASSLLLSSAAGVLPCVKTMPPLKVGN